jgi:hypothetical protein
VEYAELKSWMSNKLSRGVPVAAAIWATVNTEGVLMAPRSIFARVE